MTNQQTGREAFDLDAACDAFDDVYDGVSNNNREAIEAAVEAALAQQGREVGEPLELPEPMGYRWLMNTGRIEYSQENWEEPLSVDPDECFSVCSALFDADQLREYARQYHVANTAAPKQQAVDEVRQALWEVLDALGALGKPWELEGLGLPREDAERIVALACATGSAALEAASG